MTQEETAAWKLGLWQPGIKCDKFWLACGIFEFGRDSTGLSIVTHNHDIPCPTLTSDMISESLRKRKIEYLMESEDASGDVAVLIVGRPDWSSGPTLLAALIDACAKLPEPTK